MKGKRYMCFSCWIHAGYMQIDNTFHVCDHHGARRLHATRHTHVVRGKSTPSRPTEVFVL